MMNPMLAAMMPGFGALPGMGLMGGGLLGATGMPTASSMTGLEEVEQFLSTNSVDARAAASLRQAAPNVQQAVLDRGPLSDCTNPSAALMGRIQVASQGASFGGGPGRSRSRSRSRGRAQALPPDGAAASAEEVDEFILSNGLDSNASQALLALDPVSQKNVMNFGGLSNCRNPSAVCLARIREVRQGSAGATTSSDSRPSEANADLKAQVERFLQDNAVDSRAAATLRVQSPDVQKLVIERGELTDCTNPSAALMGRIQVAKDNCAFQRRQGGGPPPTSVPSHSSRDSGPKEMNPQIETFIRENNLDDMAARQLRDEDLKIQDEVLARGGLEDCRNPSAVCLARIREAKNARKQEGQARREPDATATQLNPMASMMQMMQSNPMMLMQQAYMQQAAYMQSMAYMQQLQLQQQQQAAAAAAAGYMQAQAPPAQADGAIPLPGEAEPAKPNAIEDGSPAQISAAADRAQEQMPDPFTSREPITKAPPEKAPEGVSAAQYAQYFGAQMQGAAAGQYAQMCAGMMASPNPLPAVPQQATPSSMPTGGPPPMKAPSPAAPAVADQEPVPKPPPETKPANRHSREQELREQMQPPPVLPANAPFAGWSVGVPSSMQAAPPAMAPPPPVADEERPEPGAPTLTLKIPANLPPGIMAVAPMPPSAQTPPVKSPPEAPWKRQKKFVTVEEPKPGNSGGTRALGAVAKVAPKPPPGSGYGPWSGGPPGK